MFTLPSSDSWLGFLFQKKVTFVRESHNWWTELGRSWLWRQYSAVDGAQEPYVDIQTLRGGFVKGPAVGREICISY